MLLLQVSEGLDFADGNARGVIIVGIPFPHAKDLKVSRQPCLTVCTCHVGGAARLPPPTLPPLTAPPCSRLFAAPLAAAPSVQVNEKKSFNDRGQKTLGLVSGDTWYSQQAFRALNQVGWLAVH